MAHSEPVIAELRLSPEVDLILACCRWPRSPDRDEAIRRAAAVRIDWQLFSTMAEGHRVSAFVHDGLRGAGVRMPDEVGIELRRRSVLIASRSLVLARTTLAISELFRANGIEALCIKGSSLEMLAYRELGLKAARDIDMLVSRADFAAASELIGGEGWTRTIPPASLREDLLEPILDLSKDATFVHEAQGIHLELHHCLAWHKTVDKVGPASPRQDVEILPGKTVPTLSNEELVIYLSVHGAIHRWSRIKWLADLAALFAQFTPGEIDDFHAAARARGAGRFTGQALRLCHHLLGTPISQALRANLDADRSVRSLCAGSLAAIEQRRPLQEEDLPTTLKMLLTEVRMCADWSSRLKVLRRYLIDPRDLSSLPLPRHLFFLYYLTRIPLLIVRRGSS